MAENKDLQGQESRRLREFAKKSGKEGVAPEVTVAVRTLMAGLTEDRETRFRRLTRVGSRGVGFEFLLSYDPAADPEGVGLLAWLDAIALDRVKAEPEPPPAAPPVALPVQLLDIPPPSPTPVPAPPVITTPWYESPGHLKVLGDLQWHFASLGRGDYEWDRYTLALKRLGETGNFSAAVAGLHGYRHPSRLGPIFERESENPNYLRSCLLALVLLHDGKISPEQFQAMILRAEVFRSRFPQLGKIELVNTLGAVLCETVGRRQFGHRLFPYVAELDAIARRARRPDISSITVIPVGGGKTPDFQVRTTDGTIYPVEVKSISDSLQMRDTVLMGDAEHKVQQALAQLGLGADDVGEIDLYVNIRNESVEERFVAALALRLQAMPEVRARPHLTVNVISSRQMAVKFGNGERSS